MSVVVGFAVALVVAASLSWRYAVRRRSLPCPEWLVPLLENPYMNWVAGAETVLDRAGIGAGMRVLDVGCGPGRITIPAAQRVGAMGEVVALDVQEVMLERLGRRIAETGMTNIETIRAGAGQGALEPGRFDRALLVTVLGEIPDRAGALLEIHHALEPGGVLSVTEVIPDPHYQRRSVVRALAAETGFTVEDEYRGWLSHTMNLRKGEAVRL